ncbi:MAG: hypothetical protein M0Q22_02610 [Sulfuritalea sp.]|jgi:hypothetical protein|nr:hypothetical protein [Sulfuritalea sp.]
MSVDAPRLLLISQWPKVRNAEFELIEKIRNTGFEIAVVDFLGREVGTGRNLNTADLRDRYDFALSFHYDTPKFIDITTFLWVANPLSYMHLREDYRRSIFNNLRAYDDYLYNGAPLLKEHIGQVVGGEWRDSGLHFFASTSLKALQSPERTGDNSPANGKIFYCGINWERVEDRQGRAHGLLEHLQTRNAADFFGPEKLEGFSTWKGFPSYRGEIPFDGISLAQTMRRYGAVLALSSPAHLKSGTSSSRVFEGFAAGVPVISDANPHVHSLFGDLVCYFSGSTDSERADSILAARDQLLSSPHTTIERVRQAQALIAEKYCFEATLAAAATVARQGRKNIVAADSSASAVAAGARAIDVFLFRHDPYRDGGAHDDATFPNLANVLGSLEEVRGMASVRLLTFADDGGEWKSLLPENLRMKWGDAIEWVNLDADQTLQANWSSLSLGEKFARLAAHARQGLSAYLTAEDFPHRDFFSKLLTDAASDPNGAESGQLHIAGFFADRLTGNAPPTAAAVRHNAASLPLYQWSKDSPVEHQLGQLVLTGKLIAKLDMTRLRKFDVLLPIAIYLESQRNSAAIKRCRHILLRVDRGYCDSHLAALARIRHKGFWATHYELPTNVDHEINALYDAFHESPAAVRIIDALAGRDLPSVTLPHPNVVTVLNVLYRLAIPAYMVLRRWKRRLWPQPGQ